MGVVFVDTETTGLDPERHEIWECALIDVDGDEHFWQLEVDLGRADPIALNIGQYHDRFNLAHVASHRQFAPQFAELTRGHHLAGAVVSFDEERLRRLLRACGACPEWHYHLIDVEALAVGYLAGQGHDHPGSELSCHRQLPWKSEELSIALGVNPDQFERHTALGDARWAQAMYLAVMGAE